MNRATRAAATALCTLTAVVAVAVPVAAQGAPPPDPPRCHVTDLTAHLEADGRFMLRFTICEEAYPSLQADRYRVTGWRDHFGPVSWDTPVTGPPGSTMEIEVPYRGTVQPTFVELGVAPMNASIFNGPTSEDTVKTVVPFVSVDAFVRRQFLDQVLREPSDGELRRDVHRVTVWLDWAHAYVNQLTDQGNSLMYPTGEVARLYDLILGRLPDRNGLDRWVRSYQAGRSLESIADVMLRSPEHRRRYGPEPDAELIRRMYRTVYEVARPNEAKVQAWVAKIRFGQTTRGTAVEAFAASKANFWRTKTRWRAVASYFLLLRRIPSEAEIAALPLDWDDYGYRYPSLVYGTYEYGRRSYALGEGA